MPHSLTDLAGLKVSAAEFLATVLETVGDPIAVVDPAGRIRFANPAALAALGCENADQLLGRDSFELLHDRQRDETPYRSADWPMLRPLATGEAVTRDLDWFVRRDGSPLPVSYVSVPIEMPDGRGVVVAFRDAEDRVRGERVRREHEAILAAQRRVATLVAGGAASAEVFAAIAREVGAVVGLALVVVWRYERDGTAAVLGAWSEHPHPFQPGSRWLLDRPTICAKVLETGRRARIDDFADVPDTVADAARKPGISSCAGAPIIVDGDAWGAITADSILEQPLPAHTERRLASFTALVATAIANTEARTQVGRLANEQAALRRVATLVAQSVPPGELFRAVTAEVGALLRTDLVAMARHDADDTVTIVATWAAGREPARVGVRFPLEEGDLATGVFRTGRSARMDGDDGVSTRIALVREELGISSSVASPILVEGRVWGALVVHSKEIEPLPADTESRLENFAELVATAISNVQARSELAASRARIVAATDEERRRVVRDLHDGAQQRLVHTVITLKLAHGALQNEQDETLPALLTAALGHAEQATAELRELAHGILPAALTQGGLRAAVDALALRMAVPVENGVAVGRLPAAVEATVYFVVAEALTNVAKHARAGCATVTARVADGTVRVQVRDDGVGGARPDGSGLLGLADRVAVLDGRLRVESPADGGTLVTADVPLGAQPRRCV